MTRLFENVSMKHLMFIALCFVLLGVVWIAVVWTSTADNLWAVPGVFLMVSGITKMVAVQVWVRVAKLGTDEHKPIKAL
jgi:uncharacterized membrane protein